MPFMRGLVSHLSVALLAVTTIAAAQTPDQTQDISTVDPTGTASFVVLLRGARVGSESVTISHNGTGWVLSSTGRLQPPIDLVTNSFNLRYGADWQPEQLSLRATVRGQPLTLTTTFGLTTANNDLVQNGRRASATQQITPRAVVLPPNFFSAYEVLAIRLRSATVGTRLPVYVAPTGEASVAVTGVASRRVSIGDQAIDLREVRATLTGPSGPVPLELWIDARGRLARLLMPAASVVILREDLATVMARVEPAHNPGDDDVFIGADGFSLGATITPPVDPVKKAPAVVFVSGPGPQDRDYTVFGVSIFGQLAGRLSKAGYFVVRYDARGVGRSGGRAESSRINEYADDAVSVVKWLRKRDDIDDHRIALVGYGDIGPIAMRAASREKSVAALALIASPGRTGREFTLEQQRQVLDRLQLSEAEKAQRLAMQVRIMDAVANDSGWDDIPPEVREQADSPWFKSWLQFDPAKVMKDIRQPVLVLTGTLDSEVPLAHADRLESLARARNKLPVTFTRKSVVAGVNHLLVRATTGHVEEYPSLDTHDVSEGVSQALIDWLSDATTSR